MKRLTKIMILTSLVLIASVIGSFVWFHFNGIQLQPTRPVNLAGWHVEPRGSGVTFVGDFVLSKGEATDNGEIGVKVLNIAATPCPGGTICLAPDAKVSLRFYRPRDNSVVCETTIASGSTSSVTKFVCAGLPFTNMQVPEVNTREGWVFVSFFNGDDSARAKR